MQVYTQYPKGEKKNLFCQINRSTENCLWQNLNTELGKFRSLKSTSSTNSTKNDKGLRSFSNGSNKSSTHGNNRVTQKPISPERRIEGSKRRAFLCQNLPAEEAIPLHAHRKMQEGRKSSRTTPADKRGNWELER
ncbi:hypothetical protein CDL15_Pgr026549 [Punica granatum]|uniref:Uncharacterized protein n=1 Tax=Punica granatum TaxID=22663 RepID=A0A218WM69_PUNGR|nr:hypothetical protein CDL15_Pgr026549 [Punica granatum]